MCGIRSKLLVVSVSTAGTAMTTPGLFVCLCDVYTCTCMAVDFTLVAMNPDSLTSARNENMFSILFIL